MASGFLSRVRKIRKIRLLSLLLAIGFSFVFQNCSEISFENTPEVQAKYACDETGNCILKSAVTLTAGVDLPPLKMFVVVDNSYTMKANQFNLASQFNQMFDVSNSNNLMPFDTTAFIFNTTQYTYDIDSTELSKMGATLQLVPDLMALSREDFNRVHRPIDMKKTLSGAVPGDVLGYEVQLVDNQWRFLPASVLGYNSDGVAGYLSPYIHKGANRSADQLAKDFQSRIQILNPDYNPDNSEERLVSGQRFFPVAQDTESAMCAMARVLRNPQSFIKNGDQSIFLMVTDEDEADPTGSRCVQRTFKTDEFVVDAYCEERTSTFTIKKPSCSVAYSTGYEVDYDYEDLVTKGIHLNNAAKGIRYQPSLSTTYKQTYVSFNETGYLSNVYKIQYKRKVYSSQKTAIKYCLAQIRDGVAINQCSGIWKSASINGNWSESAACLNKATELSGSSAIVTTGLDRPACTFNSTYTQLAKTESCDTNQATCRVDYPLAVTSLDYKGLIQSQIECRAVAAQLLSQAKITHPYDGIVDANIKETEPLCAITGTERVAGVCPDGRTCVSDPKVFSNVLVKGDFTKSAVECSNQVKKLNSFADLKTANCVEAPMKTASTKTCSGYSSAECTVNYSSTFTESSQTKCPTNDTVRNCTVLYGEIDILGRTSCSGYSGCNLITSLETISAKATLNYTANNLSGNQLMVGAKCSAEMANEILKIQPKFSSVSSKCSIGKVLSGSNSLAVQSGQTCATVASNTCSTSNGTKRFCVANENSIQVRSESVKEELSCESKCSDSKLDFCSRLPGAPGEMKIKDVMASLAGVSDNSGCMVSKSKATVGEKSTVLSTEVNSVCVASGSGTPRYIDTAKTSDPYKTALPIVDYVSGSKRTSDGSYIPEKNLRDYIVARSNELFGKTFSPIVSTFVRQPVDGDGQGGSIGTRYIELASLMKGQNTSVVTGDYAAPLRELSQIIKDRVQKSFTINQLKSGQEIRTVALFRKATNIWKVLTPDEYVAEGTSLKISDAIEFSEGDKFRIEFW